jgi:hypothetical protein
MKQKKWGLILVEGQGARRACFIRNLRLFARSPSW